jgi:3-dehydro-L-gulonate 2-dehydrogenase
MLDLITHFCPETFASGIDKLNRGSCGSCSQVFIAIDPLKNNSQEFVDNILNETIGQLKSSVPANENENIYYPGEQSLKTRKENMSLGIPVDADIWARVKALANL